MFSRSLRRWPLLAVSLLVMLLLPSKGAHAYSLLTHEQLIDLTWDSSIVPLLLSRYPTLTPAQIEHARAYAYGGCVIQDIGYYPLGDVFFSDLTHYVRSGDFVVNLFRNAGNADELAFAIGALSHNIGDSIGHAEATNLAVPVEFPKLRERYGHRVNYAEGEHQHVQAEFAFDINEIAHHRFAPVHYLRHVGLEVPVKQVSLAFYQTYGLGEDFTAHRSARINVGAYRFAVRRFIPRIAFALTVLHRGHEPADVPSPDFQKLESDLARVAAENHWSAYRAHAGIGTYMLAGFVKILPKLGPLKLLAVKGPNTATEEEYVRSVVRSETALDNAVKHFTPPPATRATAGAAAAQDPHANSPSAAPGARAASESADARRADGPSESPLRATENTAAPEVLRSPDPLHPLLNRDLDTGRPVQPAGYRLTDQTYATLLHRLTRMPEMPVPPGIKLELQSYYKDLSLPFATKANPAAWQQLQHDLVTLAAMKTSTEPEPFATYGRDTDDLPSAQSPDGKP